MGWATASVQVTGPTTANVTFSTDVCATAEYVYRSADGTDTGRHAASGWPRPDPCYTDHLAQLGSWTPALRSGTTYTVTVNVIGTNNATATWTGTFTTA